MARHCSSRDSQSKTCGSTAGALRGEERREMETPPSQAPAIARPLFGPIMVRRTPAVVATYGRRIWLPVRED